jgi:methionyl-tRNA formyltransferase
VPTPSPSAPLKILFAASSEFALPTLTALADSTEFHVRQVISQHDRPAGRGRQSQPTPVSRFALDRHLPLLRTDNINSEPLSPADLLIVIAFGQKISPELAGRPTLGSINLHASRLPDLRGAAPINWAIIRGHPSTGNSIIRLAPRMDSGAILNQSLIPIGPAETAGELHDRLAQDGAPLVLQTMRDLTNGTAIETPQDDSRATIAPRLSRSDAQIDFNHPDQTADVICRRLRGTWPWPGCHFHLLDAAGSVVSKVAIARAIPAATDESRWQPGEITVNLTIATVDNAAIQIHHLRPDGGRVMALPEYQRGHRWQPGLRLVPA